MVGSCTKLGKYNIQALASINEFRLGLYIQKRKCLGGLVVP